MCRKFAIIEPKDNKDFTQLNIVRRLTNLYMLWIRQCKIESTKAKTFSNLTNLNKY